MERSAVISTCGKYRYLLTRRWGPGQFAAWILLNPSTADAETDDATVRKVCGFSKGWGYAGAVIGNLFAFRATKPELMLAAEDPIGPDNDKHLMHIIRRYPLIVAGWSGRGGHRSRSTQVRRMVDVYRSRGTSFAALRISKRTGEPWHPLYVSYSQPLVPMSAVELF